MKRVTFKAGKETLTGVTFQKEKIDKPSLLFLHGGGVKTTLENLSPLARKLFKNGISSFLFNFSGHGKSTGALLESSLQKRIEEAVIASKFLNQKKPIVVCGTSMSGHTAIALLERLNVATLILFCPAVYDRKALKIQFGRGFTEIIRKKDSWKNSDTFEVLEKFKGKLLILVAENDKVIPPGVIQLLDEHSKNTSKKEIVEIPNSPHKIHPFLVQHKKESNLVVKKIMEYL